MSHSAFGAKIKVIGVGGGGGNAVNTMIRSGLDGVEFIVANTDSQALQASLAQHKIQLGKELTKGLGAGADPDIGRDAALEDRHELQDLLSDADMVFITAGMGGGTGTGAAAIVAQIAREMGALTVAVVTKPFIFEGKRRRKNADMGINRLREAVDTLITIPNQRLLQIATPDLSMLDAFKLADNVLVNAVRGISDIINTPGLINVDFADVKTVMSSMGHALMGIGYGIGAERALSAAKQAISSPLLEDIDIEGATGILINITAGTNVSIMEVNNACMVIQEAAHEDANIIFGAVIDESLGEEIRITVIATGFPVEEQSAGVEDTSNVNAVSRFSSGNSAIHTSSQRPHVSNASSHVVRPFNSLQRPIVSNRHSSHVSTTASKAGATHPVTPSQDSKKASASQAETPNESHFTTKNDRHFFDPEIVDTQLPATDSLIDRASSQSRSTADQIFVSEALQGSSLASLDSSEPPLRAGAESASGDRRFFEIQNTLDQSIALDIDKRIDEALAMANRLSGAPKSSEEHRFMGDHDDLDLPAFLRNPNHELPKS